MFFESGNELSKADITGFNSLKHYPIQELYRLVVDGDLQKNENGWLKYEERDPGCLKAFFDALLFISQNDGKSLTLEYLQTIHYLLDHFHTTEFSHDSGHFRENSFIQIGGSFLINNNNASAAGILEFLNRLESSDELNSYNLYITSKTEKPISIDKSTLKEVKEKRDIASNKDLADLIYELLKTNPGHFTNTDDYRKFYHLGPDFIKTYYSEMAKAEDDDSKILAMVTLAQRFDQFHPYYDKNIRTFAILMLMRLMMQNDMTIPSFDNPNKFDLHSHAELVDLVKKAMATTKEVYQGKAVYDFDTNSMSEEDKEKFKTIVQEFESGITSEKSAHYNNLMLDFKLYNLEKTGL